MPSQPREGGKSVRWSSASQPYWSCQSIFWTHAERILRYRFTPIAACGTERRECGEHGQAVNEMELSVTKARRKAVPIE